MAFARARAVRSLQQALARPTLRNGAAAGRRRTELVAKRWASGGAHPPSSDLPWLLAGVVVTVPVCYYLWPSSTHADHHGHEESHAEGSSEESSEEPSEGAEPPVEKPKEESDTEQKEVEKEDAEKVESGEDKPKEDTSAADKKGGDESSDSSSESGSEGGEQSDSTDATEDSGAGGEGKDAQFKGPVKGGAPDERKSEDDSKGGKKRRIDSSLAKTLEDGSATGGNPGKQKGISNTDTKHSTAINEDPNKSKKGEGTPDTAKSQGAVDPNRPAR